MRRLFAYPLYAVLVLAILSTLALSAGSPVRTSAGCQAEWKVVSSPNGAGEDNGLDDLTIISPNDIWAVGRTGLGLSPLNTLTEHWDGSNWKVVPSPNGIYSANYLTSVSAVTTDDVWAVGYSFNNSVPNPLSKTLILHWDGSAWNVIPSPNTAEPENRLHSVVAISTDDVWAVGISINPSVYKTLIMHWDGSDWSIVPSPNPGAFANFLYDIDAVSANNIWAVGTQQDSLEQTLVLHWNGSNWSVVPSPNIGPFGNNMLAISVRAPDDIWATGFHLTVFGVEQPYQTSIFHYNGSAWSAVASPNVNQENNYLFDIVGITQADAWAVGFYDTGTSLDSMVQHWNGASWTIESSPNPGTYANEMIGVAAVSSTDIWSVGDTTDGVIGIDTLVMHYAESCGTATPTRTLPTTPPGSTPTATKTPRGTPGAPTPTATSTPGGGGTMHIGDLDGTGVSDGAKWTATVVVTVFSQSETPVANAVVSGSWSNGASGNGTCTTNAVGKCSIVRPGIRNSSGSVTFTVTDITHSVLEYEPGDNHDPDGDSNGTMIVIAKP